MSDTLGEAAALLNNLLALSRTTTSVVDQGRLDALVNSMAQHALDQLGQFADRVEAAAAARDEEVAAAEVAAAENVLATEAAEAQSEIQDAEDQAERDERHAAGVS